jgi:hypothetical protein
MKRSLCQPRPTAAALAAVPITLISAAVLWASGAVLGNVHAQTTIPAPALTDWNLVNALTVNPSAQNGRTYIYPDKLTRDSDTFEDGTGSVGFIGWSQDDASGRAPGIQTVTNDLDFRVNNCIMASGIRHTGLSKTCSDPQGSSKRFKVMLTEVNAPIDLVFDVDNVDNVYDDGLDLNDVEVGRVYRVLMRLANRTGERFLNIKVELGFGVGNDFDPVVDAGGDGIAFELRTAIENEFFGRSLGGIEPGHGGGADCVTCHQNAALGDTIPQVHLNHGGGEPCNTCHTSQGTRQVWNPNRFANFAFMLFDSGEEDPRFDVGFFDDERAGLFPPQDFEAGDKSWFIDSGTAVDAATGIKGATTANYFDLFGYLLPREMVATGIFEDLDGDPATEGSLIAWWDGANWRYGFDRDFAIVPAAKLIEWAARPLSEDEALPGPRYETAPITELYQLNGDIYIYLGEDFDVGNETITLRLTAMPAVGIFGADPPAWVDSPAPPLSSYARPGAAWTGLPPHAPADGSRFPLRLP